MWFFGFAWVMVACLLSLADAAWVDLQSMGLPPKG